MKGKQAYICSVHEYARSVSARFLHLTDCLNNYLAIYNSGSGLNFKEQNKYNACTLCKIVGQGEARAKGNGVERVKSMAQNSFGVLTT